MPIIVFSSEKNIRRKSDGKNTFVLHLTSYKNTFVNAGSITQTLEFYFFKGKKESHLLISWSFKVRERKKNFFMTFSQKKVATAEVRGGKNPLLGTKMGQSFFCKHFIMTQKPLCLACCHADTSRLKLNIFFNLHTLFFRV